MKLLIIDNYDSFTYNLVHAFRRLGVNPSVFRNDKITVDYVAQYDKIVISPGPGIPQEAGILLPLLERWIEVKPILGVCLGHQAIAEVLGARLYNLSEVYHGVQTPMTVMRDDYLFADMPKEISVGRYHSWAVDKQYLPECVEVIGEDKDGIIMALRHKEYDVRGVQFHPESILTPYGEEILKNWLEK